MNIGKEQDSKISKRLLHWLHEFGILSAEQMYCVGMADHEKVKFNINALVRERRIFRLYDELYYSITPEDDATFNDRLVSASWIAISFLPELDPLNISAVEDDPRVQVRFICDDTVYDVAVFFRGEERLLKLLKPQEDTKFLICIPTEKDIDRFARYLPDGIECSFVIVKKEMGSERPEICFYG